MANVTMIPARVNRRAKREEQETEIPKTRVAAYCRVSTDSDEQATSYEMQVEHYTEYISKNPGWNLRAFMPMMVSAVLTPRKEKILIE
ncbi:hypothetical protein [Cellulosilyticum ruminicola]